jgi:uncharacterized protein YutE (UPF0331/DUF86 family)
MYISPDNVVGPYFQLDLEELLQGLFNCFHKLQKLSNQINKWCRRNQTFVPQ